MIYTQGMGLGDVPFMTWFTDIATNAVDIDLGEGAIALEKLPAGEFIPTRFSAGLPSPPDGVPFGQAATLAIDFSALDDMALEILVPATLEPLNHDLAATSLGSAEISDWTWANPGGPGSLELVVTMSNTPVGGGWSEWVELRCEIADDGAFDFPVEYLDLAREHLGSELFASIELIRTNRGNTPLAGGQLAWRSDLVARAAVAIVD
ncbi:MAG: hypothetical protein KC431_16555 [Myxococcales bacterium]|nr:hypothetical protein [Myxococcales bacterium]